MEDSKSPTWLLSELSGSVYDVACAAGEKMRGIRLEPGTQIDQLTLVKWMEPHHVNELFIADQIDEFCERSTSLSEILQCFSHQEAESVQAVANELGVSLRTLQRVIKSGTQRTPYFWFSLARMRTKRTTRKFLNFSSSNTRPSSITRDVSDFPTMPISMS